MLDHSTGEHRCVCVIHSCSTTVSFEVNMALWFWVELKWSVRMTRSSQAPLHFDQVAVHHPSLVSPRRAWCHRGVVRNG